MAANIEQIFQDFILNKIKEIEEQKEEQTVSVAENSLPETCRKASSPEKSKRSRSPSPHKKHRKKSKKHKSKKKKKNKGKERDSSDSDSDSHGKHRHWQHRSKEERASKDKDHERTSSRHRHKSPDEDKRKKKRKKSRERGSDSESERRAKRDETNGPSHQPQLPDIIPKQESSSKTNRKQESPHRKSSRSRTRSRSGSHPRSQSHSSGHKSESKTGDHRKSRTRSRSSEKPSSGETPAPVQPSISELLSAERLSSSTELHLEQEQGLTVEEPSAKPVTAEKKKRLKKKHKKQLKVKVKLCLNQLLPTEERQSLSSEEERAQVLQEKQEVQKQVQEQVSQPQEALQDQEPPEEEIQVQVKGSRSPAGRKHGSSSSPHRISELDKEQLLEIAKANAAAMCVKAGMPVPSSLRSTAAPLTLPLAMNPAMASMTAASMTAALSNISTLLPSLSTKPASATATTTTSLNSALEEVKKSVQKQANIISIKEFTEKCKMIVDSKGELPVAAPHVSDEEDEGKPFGAAASKSRRLFALVSITWLSVRLSGATPESPKNSPCPLDLTSKKEGEGQGAYGEWVPVEKTSEKNSTNPKKSSAATAKSSTETGAGAEPEQTVEHDSVFPEPPLQPVDISQAVSERIKAQRRLAENPMT
ncbi:hypothetical protein WMY93_022736 [Mugilogobius chulae]|uniref:Uncharacterized protein n=1 Tax=Mugilogobius chulae TaxID=88201 RepID=A0AAW0NK36_9GOBI